MLGPSLTGLRRMTVVIVKAVDFLNADHVRAMIALLDMYARDPMGGGHGLADAVKSRLPEDLANMAGAINLVAWSGDEAVGLLNAFAGYSTFKAQPLVNVHDVAVLPAHRAKGVGQALLTELERVARERGYCKITLEVLSGNTHARRSYERFGFEDYALDPKMGAACFMQKWL